MRCISSYKANIRAPNTNDTAKHHLFTPCRPAPSASPKLTYMNAMLQCAPSTLYPHKGADLPIHAFECLRIPILAQGCMVAESTRYVTNSLLERWATLLKLALCIFVLSLRSSASQYERQSEAGIRISESHANEAQMPEFPWIFALSEHPKKRLSRRPRIFPCATPFVTV